MSTESVSKRGEAKCENGHTWPVTWTIGESRVLGGGTKWTRIVVPPNCPECYEKWKEVVTP